MTWTDEQKQRAGTLWNEGKSANEIARMFGAGVTRNAVISVIHRAGLSTRAAISAPTTRQPRASDGGAAATAAAKVRSDAAKARPAAKPKPVLRVIAERQTFVQADAPPPRVIVPKRGEDPGLRTVLTVRAFECRWPIGDPQDPAFTLCGVRCVGTYCGAHAARAHVPTPPTRQLARALRRYA